MNERPGQGEQTATRQRRRLPVEDRRRQFLDAAIELFSEHGFSANTRQLAASLGTTQPLLFRYFPRKDDLIEAVLEEVYQRHSRTDWLWLIADRSVDLKTRLLRFTQDYAAQIYDRKWIRLYMFAGLADSSFNRRYIDRVTDPLLRTIAVEVRADCPGVSTDPSAVSQAELDYIWIFHGGLYYQAIRHHIYGEHRKDAGPERVLDATIDAMVTGLKAIIAEQQPAGAPRAPQG